MPDASTFALFALAALALFAVPGPAVLYIVTRSIDVGRRAGLVSVLGLHTGTLVHVAAAAVGISSLIAASATAFAAVKYAGAAYLVLLGLRRLLAREERPPAEDADRRRDPRRLYVDGIVVNVLNPKTALFFLAFLPQFVDPARGAVPLQVLVLGAVFVALGLVADGLWALAVGSTAARLRGSLRWARVRRYVAGTVFVGLGVATAVAGSQRSTS